MADNNQNQQPLNPNAVPFALAPALVNPNQPLDYSTRSGQNLWTQATKALPVIFDGTAAMVPAFMQSIRTRSSQCGWDDIFHITTGEVDELGGPVSKHLLTSWGGAHIEASARQCASRLHWRTEQECASVAADSHMPSRVYHH